MGFDWLRTLARASVDGTPCATPGQRDRVGTTPTWSDVRHDKTQCGSLTSVSDPHARLCDAGAGHAARPWFRSSSRSLGQELELDAAVLFAPRIGLVVRNWLAWTRTADRDPFGGRAGFDQPVLHGLGAIE